MGRFWSGRSDHSLSDAVDGAGADLGGPSSRKAQTIDRLTIATLALVLIGASLLGWSLHSQSKKVATLVQGQRAAARAQQVEIQKLERIITDLEGDVQALPTSVPAPRVTVIEKPGETVVIVRTLRPAPSPSEPPTPTPEPRPSPQNCVPKNKPHVCL